ncbi:MAG: hypothetical protein FWG17_06020 [Desulfovibrionaceae bacterium]|nr:hypothetical protein [Desulfovibrionaceae bacterium]
MSDDARHNTNDKRQHRHTKHSPDAENRPEPEDRELARLRSLLFQKELNMLHHLATQTKNRSTETEHLSRIIAEALILRANKDDNLDLALSPLVGKLVRSSLRTNRREFTDALFPLMGPTIRKSISESFRGMLGNFSKSMEMSFSWKGLRWRLEGLRSGKSFSEVVLLHTLVYRVEEVFLIHSHTGINLMQLADENIDVPDAGMISAMLTAIQDFVQDCLASGKEGNLESMQHGERTVMVEKHPLAYLACIVRGVPPADFREQMRSCLEYILVEYGDKLEQFNGDAAPFAACAPQLEKLLRAHFVDEDRPIPIWTKILFFLCLSALIGGLAHYKWKDYQTEKLLKEENARLLGISKNLWEAADRLRQEPGFVIFHVEPSDKDPWQIFGLKDKHARSPEAVLRESSHNPEAFGFRMLPFISYDPLMVRARIDETILPPETAQMRLHDGVLHLSGTATMEWIMNARHRAMLIPGVRDVDIKKISDPRMSAILAMIREVENTVVEFPSGRDTPIPQDLPKLNTAVDTLVNMEKLAGQMGLLVSMTIYGHADATGSPQVNYEISQARTKTIAAMLYSKGSSMPISIYGLGADYPESSAPKADQSHRRVEMRVRLSRAGDAPLDFLQ